MSDDVLICNDEGEMQCPRCGAEDTHQGLVDIFERKEDEQGIHVRVGGPHFGDEVDDPFVIQVDRNMADNPSSRRHGLTIRFWCEHCPAKSILGIWQHKGRTFIQWVK